MSALSSERSAATAPEVGSQPFDPWLIVAVALGIAVRLFHVLRSDFPLNDGGLFLMMIEAIRAKHYVLPDSIPWAQFELPFAYPPFGFYLAAALRDMTGIRTVDLLRILPLVGSAGTLVAFALLARSLLAERIASVAAVFAFALMPQGFAWSIAGGGLTRALGQLFALLALYELLLLFRKPSTLRVVAAAVCSSLCVLTHPESALLLAATALLMTAFYARSRIGVGSAGLVGVGTLVLTSWWWAIVLSRYGAGTFLAAGGNSGGVSAVIAVAASPLTEIPGGPLIGPLFLLGVVVVWQIDRTLFLPAWLLAVALLSRSFYVYSAPPIALLAGVGAARVLFPGLDSAVSGTPGVRGASSSAQSLLGFVAAMIVLYSLGASLQLGVPTLPRSEREAMAWIAGNTPASASFLVLTARQEGSTVDPTGDWFAALTGRRGLSPPQGTEWLGKYAAVEASYAELQACRSEDAGCLERWAHDQQLDFDFVYVPASASSPNGEQSCCVELLNSLRSEGSYRLAYDGAGASVFERTGSASSPQSSP